MLKRRAPRIARDPGSSSPSRCSGLTACRTSPNVAAYVGDEQVTVSELEAAVDERPPTRTSPPSPAAQEDGVHPPGAHVLVQEEVHAVAAERYGVRGHRRRGAGADRRAARRRRPGHASTASSPSRASAGRTCSRPSGSSCCAARSPLAAGEAEEPSDEELQAQYEEVREAPAQVRFGYITVPDQATADARARPQLAGRPGRLRRRRRPVRRPVHAARARGPRRRRTSPARWSSRSPRRRRTPPSRCRCEEVQGVIVTFVEGTVYPSFEELRPQLEQEFTEAADAAGSRPGRRRPRGPRRRGQPAVRRPRRHRRSSCRATAGSSRSSRTRRGGADEGAAGADGGAAE